MPSAPTTTQRHSLWAGLSKIASEIGDAKNISIANHVAPSSKSAADAQIPKDPGGYTGGSTHPSADAANGGVTQPEGSRASENSKDVKEQVGAPSVENAQPIPQDPNPMDLGLKASPTGGDPATEDAYKATKDDPGTAHPAKADDGEKYGNMKFAEIHRQWSDTANAILADTFNRRTTAPTKSAAVTPAPAVTPTSPAVQPPAQTGDLPAGYELASFLGLDKTAAQHVVAQTLLDTHTDAITAADLFIANYYQTKRAMAEMSESHEGKGDEANEHTEGPPAGGGGPPSLPEVGGPGGPPSGPGADLGAGPAGGPGGDMPVGEDEARMELLSALQELLANPELLAQLQGGAPPGADGMSEGMKLAAAATDFARSGRYRYKEAGDGTRERKIRDYWKSRIRQLAGW